MYAVWCDLMIPNLNKDPEVNTISLLLELYTSMTEQVYYTYSTKNTHFSQLM